MNWQIKTLNGTPQEVKDQMAKDSKLPKNWQDAINADIAALPKPPTSAIVAAFSNDYDGRNGKVRNIQITIRY